MGQNLMADFCNYAQIVWPKATEFGAVKLVGRAVSATFPSQGAGPSVRQVFGTYMAWHSVQSAWYPYLRQQQGKPNTMIRWSGTLSGSLSTVNQACSLCISSPPYWPISSNKENFTKHEATQTSWSDGPPEPDQSLSVIRKNRGPVHCQTFISFLLHEPSIWKIS